MNLLKTRIKAARDLLGISQSELCEAAGIPLITLRRIEGKPDHVGLVSQAQIDRVLGVLADRGIHFIERGQVADGPGIVMRGEHHEKP